MFKCLICGKGVLAQPIIVGGKISGELAFHWYDTHGLPVEITEHIINKILKERLIWPKQRR